MAVLEAEPGRPETMSSLTRFLPLAPGQPASSLFQLRHLILQDRHFSVSTSQEFVTLKAELVCESAVKLLTEQVAPAIWPPTASPRTYARFLLAKHIIDKQRLQVGADDVMLLAVPRDAAGRFEPCPIQPVSCGDQARQARTQCQSCYRSRRHVCGGLLACCVRISDLWKDTTHRTLCPCR